MKTEGMEKGKMRKRMTEGNKQGRVCMQKRDYISFTYCSIFVNNMIFCEALQFEMGKVILI